MKDYKSALASFIEIVTFLLAAFGGFLKQIAPPSQVGASFPVGIVSFLMLIILMLFSAMGRNAPSDKVRKRWVAAGMVFFLLAVPASFIYPNALSKYTYPPDAKLEDRKICASDTYLTDDARAFKTTNPSDGTAQGLESNLPKGDVWTPQGITRAQQLLLAAYASLVLTISSAIFCLLEATLGSKTPVAAASPANPGGN
jgi:hypothetical protein